MTTLDEVIERVARARWVVSWGNSMPTVVLDDLIAQAKEMANNPPPTPEGILIAALISAMEIE